MLVRADAGKRIVTSLPRPCKRFSLIPRFLDIFTVACERNGRGGPKRLLRNVLGSTEKSQETPFRNASRRVDNGYRPLKESHDNEDVSTCSRTISSPPSRKRSRRGNSGGLRLFSIGRSFIYYAIRCVVCDYSPSNNFHSVS